MRNISSSQLASIKGHTNRSQTERVSHWYRRTKNDLRDCSERSAFFSITLLFHLLSSELSDRLSVRTVNELLKMALLTRPCETQVHTPERCIYTHIAERTLTQTDYSYAHIISVLYTFCRLSHAGGIMGGGGGGL